MHARRAGGILLGVGLVLLAAPLYWEVLVSVGLAPILDPAAAIGVGTGGGYPAAVGAAATAVGSVVVRGSEHQGRPSTPVLTAGVAGAALGIVATIVLAGVPRLLAIRVGLAGAAPGFAAVIGAAVESSRQRLGAGLVVLALVPFVGAQLLRGAFLGGLAGAASLGLGVGLVVYTAVLSYPFYRVGRAVRPAPDG